jgi:predicted ArsR family transcriptional regulator
MQQSIFEVVPYVQRNMNSLDAAVSMVGKTATLRERVLQAIKERPSTDEELSIRLNLAPNTCRPRRVELARDGLIVTVANAKTASGRNASVWSVPANIGDK